MFHGAACYITRVLSSAPVLAARGGEGHAVAPHGSTPPPARASAGPLATRPACLASRHRFGVVVWAPPFSGLSACSGLNGLLKNQRYLFILRKEERSRSYSPHSRPLSIPSSKTRERYRLKRGRSQQWVCFDTSEGPLAGPSLVPLLPGNWDREEGCPRFQWHACLFFARDRSRRPRPLYLAHNARRRRQWGRRRRRRHAPTPQVC